MSALALWLLFLVLLAYILAAGLAVFYVAVGLPQALGVPIAVSVGAGLAIGGLLANFLLRTRHYPTFVGELHAGAKECRSHEEGQGRALVLALKRKAVIPPRSRRCKVRLAHPGASVAAAPLRI
jgi:hypothetical protein